MNPEQPDFLAFENTTGFHTAESSYDLPAHVCLLGSKQTRAVTPAASGLELKTQKVSSSLPFPTSLALQSGVRMNGQFYVSSCSGIKTILILTFISVGNSHLDGELTTTEQGQALDLQLSGQQREPKPLTARPSFVCPLHSKQASSNPHPHHLDRRPWSTTPT